MGSDSPPITGTIPGKPTPGRISSPVETSNFWTMLRAAYWLSVLMSAAV